VSSRRKFLTRSVGAVAGGLVTSKSWTAENAGQPAFSEGVPLCGEWRFRTDPDDRGAKNNWYGTSVPGEAWRTVTVPHTWQVGAPLADYRGVAWYWRSFDLRARKATASSRAVRLEFEAVFHSATV
jgi:beta-galactosidase/beta-glucuronidase